MVASQDHGVSKRVRPETRREHDMKDQANDRKGEKTTTNVVRLDDLAPRHDSAGEAGQLVFGEGVVGERAPR